MKMKDQFAKAAKPLGTLFAAAVIMTVIVRIAEAVMGSMGVLDYSYRLAESPIALDGTLFDKVLAVSSGATFFGFLVVSAVVVAIAVAFAFVCAHAMEGGQGSAVGRFGAECIWGVIAVVVSLVCMLVVTLGLFSGTQLSLAGGAAGGTSMGAMPLFLLLALSTLLVAMAEAVRFSRSAGSGQQGPSMLRTLLAVALCSAAAALCTAGVFAGLDTDPLNAGAATLWLAVALVLNVVLALGMGRASAK